MKKISLISVLYCINAMTVFSAAENYNMFKVDLGGVFPYIPGSNAYAGAGAYFHPKFNALDELALGIRAEADGFISISTSATSGSGEVAGIVSYAFTGEYYFTTSEVRPFAGLAIGRFKVAAARNSISVDIDDPVEEMSTIAGIGIGLTPEFGVYLGPLRLSAKIHIIKLKKAVRFVEVIDSDGNVTQTYKIGGASSMETLIGFDIGFVIGGGRKD